MIRDRLGNLYGTTNEGGNTSCASGSGCGTVFKLDGSGKETVLHAFRGADGEFPTAGVIRNAAGNLYGTTHVGGDPSCNPPFGCGTVFKLTSGHETVLHTSEGGANGAYPAAAVIRDGAGNLYGTTFEGGDTSCLSGSGCGTVFRLDASGRKSVLYSFTGGARVVRRSHLSDGFRRRLPPWAR